MSLTKISKSFLISVFTLTSFLSGMVQAEDCAKAKQYYSLGTKLSDYGERRAAFEKAVNLCPSMADAHTNLADAFEHLAVIHARSNVSQSDLFEKAVEHYRKAIEINPNSFIPYIGLGEAYAARGQNRYAERAFETALRLKPGYERAETGLAAVRQVIAKDEAEQKRLSTDGPKKAEEIIQHVKISRLSEEMSSMGPADYTVVRARLRFPNIIFDGWSAKISRKESLEQLDEIGRALSSKELERYAFWIEGHANTVGLEQRGGAEKLQRLSEERAEAVKSHLVRKYDIASNRITARGFGCTRPQFPDDSYEHREKNRRVEIVFCRADAD